MNDVRTNAVPPPQESRTDWHLLPGESVISLLGSSSSGLSRGDASRRLDVYGPNELRDVRRVMPWMILLEQFKNVLILILLAATAFSAFLGHAIEALAIAIIVLFAVLLGFIQEYRAERAIQALRRMAAPTAAVLRDGQESCIPARDLVPGDVVLLRAGDKIPADVRLIEAVNMQLDEAALTGESTPVEKRTAALSDGNLALGDRENMAYAGTVVTSPFANKWLNLAILSQVALLIVIVYVPFLQAPFTTFSMSVSDWVIVVAVAFTVSPVLELAKWMARHGWLGELT